MKKRFLTNLALLILLNLLIKPFWFFGIEVGVQNRVGEEIYGFYFSLFNFSIILNILLDVGINNFNNRAIAREPGLVGEYLAAIIPLKLALFTGYALITWIAGKSIGYSPDQFSMLRVLVLNQFLASFILYLRTNISGLQYFRTDSLLSVLDRTLMILITGMLLWGNVTSTPFRIEWFVHAQTLSYAITLVVCAVIVRYRSGKFIHMVNVSRSLGILRKSYPFALLILLMSVFNRIDSVMLERMLGNGKEQAGIYAQSFRIFDAVSQFALLFSMLLLPMFSRMIRLKEDVNELIRIGFPLLMAAALSLALASNFFGHEIIDLLYVSNAPESARIFKTLMTGFLFVSSSYIFGTLLTANNNLRQLNLLAGTIVVINVTLNLILIPRLEAYGAALSSLVSQAVFALVQFLLALRFLRLPFNGDLFIRLGGFLVINLGIGFAANMLRGWQTGFFILLISCVATSFLLGLIRPKEIRNILRSNAA